MSAPGSDGIDLRHHGDDELESGLLDCAVNVRLPGPPPWLRARLLTALDRLGSYPEPHAAVAAVARRHQRSTDEVLLTAGAAEAFVLLARAYAPHLAAVVHPGFTEPEVALRAASRPGTRVLLSAADGFSLAADRVPDEADLVIVGNPTNPTGVLHRAATLAALARPGRLLVVDEAFMDFVPGAAESVAARSDLPGLVVVRSPTKTWGLAGLRAGYLLAAPEIVATLRAAQPPWPVSSLACAAIEACSAPSATAAAAEAAGALADERARYADALAAMPGVAVVPAAAANFLLLQVTDGIGLRAGLRDKGIAVRRGETFPGLGPDWVRVTVRERRVNDLVLAAIADVLPSLVASPPVAG